MAHQIIEVKEREEIGIDIGKLIVGSSVSIDERIARKNYVSIAFSRGQIRVSSTRFVGLIPFNEHYSIRIVPRLSLSNLTSIIVRGGTAPSVIEGYTRGYIPIFSQTDRALEVCARTLISSTYKIAQSGLVKDYVHVENPPQWRGKLLVSQTAERFRAKGIRYRAAFDYNTLSKDIPINRLIKAALIQVLETTNHELVNRARRTTIRKILGHFDAVDHAAPSLNEVPRLARGFTCRVPALRAHYDKALWASFSILQGVLPDLTREQSVKLDSLIVDMATAFEGFVRAVLREHLAGEGIDVEDGNRSTVSEWFFVGGSLGYSVHPDLVLKKGGVPFAIFDVKYKPAPKDQDRYELLSFMEAYGVSIGGFVCPRVNDNEIGGHIGQTRQGKQMYIFRFDLAATDLPAEELTFLTDVRSVISV